MICATTAVTPPSTPATPIAATTPTGGALGFALTPPVDDGGAALSNISIYVNGALVDVVPVSTTTYIDYGLSPSATYAVAVAARNAAGLLSARSPLLQLETTAPTVPGAPALSGATPSGGAIAVAYGPPLDVGGYPILSYAFYVNGAQRVVRAAAAARQVVLGGLQAQTPYEIRVTSTNAVGQGPPAVAVVTTVAASTPSMPVGFIVLPQTQSSVLLVWSAPEDTGSSPVTNFEAQYRQSASGGAWISVAVGLASGSVVSGLTGSTSYDFTLVRIHTCGWVCVSLYVCGDVLVPCVCVFVCLCVCVLCGMRMCMCM